MPVLCIYYTQKLTRNTQKAVTLSILILRQKSELVQLPEASTTIECAGVDVKVFDAAPVVNMLPPGKSKTFKDYATIQHLYFSITSSKKHRISKE